MMLVRSLLIAGMILSAAAPVFAQSEGRSVGFRSAVLAVRDGGIDRGTRIRLDVHAEYEEGSFHEGVVEGLLRAGMIVYTGEEGPEADASLSFISRGRISGDVTVSVIGRDIDESRYLFSNAYVIPVHEQSVLESLLAPVVVLSSAILIVYLLLTVRSS